MVDLEPRAPVGVSQDALDRAREVDGEVAHEEEGREERRDVVDVSKHDGDLKRRKRRHKSLPTHD